MKKEIKTELVEHMKDFELHMLAKGLINPTDKQASMQKKGELS